MKAFKTLLVSIILFSIGSAVSAQEYDDLYFSPKDRVTIKYATADGSNESLQTYRSYTNNNYSSAYSAKQVNPELIAKYSQDSRDAVNQEFQQDGNQSYSANDYYVEDYTDDYDEPLYNRDAGQTTINNYYGGAVNNPMWSNTRWNVSMMVGYSPWMGWGTGFGVGFNMGWGNTWFGGASPYWGGFYDPWYNPYAWGGFYDPWGYRPGWTYGRPWYGGGYNRWSYNQGFYDGYYYGGGHNGTRSYVRGGRYSRTGNYYRSNVSRNNSYRSTAESSRSVNRAAESSNRTNARVRDYSNTQNEYYNRSRRGYSSNTSGSNSRSRVSTPANARTTRESTVAAPSRSSRTYSDNISRSRTNTSNSRVVTPGSSQRRYNSNTSGASRNYSRPSSGSRSSGWNNGGSNSRSRSFTPSRSNSRGGGYSAPSRSSGGSPSRSSGGGGSSRSRRGGN